MKSVITSIADCVVQKGGRLVSWMWFSRYDETPQSLTVIDDSLMEEFPSVFGRTREALSRASLPPGVRGGAFENAPANMGEER